MRASPPLFKIPPLGLSVTRGGANCPAAAGVTGAVARVTGAADADIPPPSSEPLPRKSAIGSTCGAAGGGEAEPKDEPKDAACVHAGGAAACVAAPWLPNRDIRSSPALDGAAGGVNVGVTAAAEADPPTPRPKRSSMAPMSDVAGGGTGANVAPPWTSKKLPADEPLAGIGGDARAPAPKLGVCANALVVPPRGGEAPLDAWL